MTQHPCALLMSTLACVVSATTAGATGPQGIAGRRLSTLERGASSVAAARSVVPASLLAAPPDSPAAMSRGEGSDRSPVADGGLSAAKRLALALDANRLDDIRAALLEKPPIVENPHCRWGSCLTHAERRAPESLGLLFEALSDTELANHRLYRNTPLTVLLTAGCAGDSCAATVAHLLRKGARPEETDAQRITARQLACLNGYEKVGKLLGPEPAHPAPKFGTGQWVVRRYLDKLHWAYDGHSASWALRYPDTQIIRQCGPRAYRVRIGRTYLTDTKTTEEIATEEQLLDELNGNRATQPEPPAAREPSKPYDVNACSGPYCGSRPASPAAATEAPKPAVILPPAPAPSDAKSASEIYRENQLSACVERCASARNCSQYFSTAAGTCRDTCYTMCGGR